MAALTFQPPALAPPFAHMLLALTRAGHGVWVVGGWVRDQLLGVPAHDADFCTTAGAEAIDGAARAAGVAVLLDQVAAMHGTYRLAAAGKVMDLARLREDVQRLGARHAQVRFTQDLALDLARRDLTINALALPYPLPSNPEAALVDLHGGRGDLQARVLRLIGNPDQRLQEDPLRLLRVARFAALDPRWRVDQATAAAMVRCAPLVATVSSERRLAELQRALASSVPARFWQLAEASGAWASLLPADVDRAARNRATAALAAVAPHLEDPALRWASFVWAGVHGDDAQQATQARLAGSPGAGTPAADPGRPVAAASHQGRAPLGPAHAPKLTRRSAAGEKMPGPGASHVPSTARGVGAAGHWLAPLRFSRAWQQICATVVDGTAAPARAWSDADVVAWALALGPVRLDQLAAWAKCARHAQPLAAVATATASALARAETLRAGRALWKPQQLQLDPTKLFAELKLPAGHARGTLLQGLLVHVWLHPEDNVPVRLQAIAAACVMHLSAQEKAQEQPTKI